MTTETNVQEGSYRDYWDSVEALADDVKEQAQFACNEGWSFDLHDYMHEITDGSEWVIYTWRNLKVLEHSNNRDAIEEQGIDVDHSQGLDHVHTQYAYFALQQDIYDALDGFDPDDLEPESTDHE